MEWINANESQRVLSVSLFQVEEPFIEDVKEDEEDDEEEDDDDKEDDDAGSSMSSSFCLFDSEFSDSAHLLHEIFWFNIIIRRIC